MDNTIEKNIFNRLYLSTYGMTEISKNELENISTIRPTIKKEALIVRQKDHPFGDWAIFKPSLKHRYFVRALSPIYNKV